MKASNRSALGRALAAAGLAGAILAGAASAQGVHAHYENLLERGSLALERGEAESAVKLLRLACFGMLEEPPRLADCLTRLGLAQAAVGDDEAFADVFRRLEEVEDRFGAYGEATTAPALRAAFEAEVTARMPARTLSASSSFAHLAPPEPPADAGPPAVSPPAVGRPAAGAGEDVTAAAAPEPAPPRTEGGSDELDEPVLVPPEPPLVAATPTDALAPADRETLERARSLLAAARDRGQLEEPLRLARRVADAHPGSREAQHLAAEIAYRAARWQEAVRYFRQGGEPEATAAETLFYFAVSLYENGEPEEAQAVLRRSLPRLERTPFVRSYEEKILGAAASPRARAGSGDTIERKEEGR